MSVSSFSAKHDTGDPVRNAELAVRDLREQTAGRRFAQVIYFAGSGAYDMERTAALMKEAFPDALTAGCSASGEMLDEQMLTDSIVAMGFGPGVFESFDMTVLRRLDDAGAKNNPRAQVAEAFARFEKTLGSPMAAHDKYVGFVLADALQYYVEPVLDAVGDLTSVPFIGGNAGDNAAFRNTPVLFDGRAYTDAVVLGVAKPSGKFALLKTQGLRLLDRTFVITGADEERRVVTHFDGRPAATVYSEAIGVPEESLEFAGAFAEWPFGLMAGDEPYLEVGFERLPDSSIRFVTAMKEGMRLRLGRMTDIVDSTRAALEGVRERLGGISAILHINCISRGAELKKQGNVDAFGALFHGFPHIAFGSHGECHIVLANQTSIMLVFG